MMDDLGVHGFDTHGTYIRKRRSQSSRRPRSEAHTLAMPQIYHENHDTSSPLSSPPVSDELCRLSGNENIEVTNAKEKILNLNQCISRCTPPTPEGSFHARKRKKNGESDFTAILGDGADNGHGGSSGNMAITVNGTGSENRLKKVKLKVGGVTRTIQAGPSSNGISSFGDSNSGGSGKVVRSSDVPRSRQKESTDGIGSPFNKKIGVQGIPRKGFSQGSSNFVKEEDADTVRKSRRVPKRRAVNEAFDEDDDNDAEIRYLEKLKTSRMAGYREFDEEPSTKVRKYESVGHGERFGKDGKKSRFEDTEYEEGSMCDFDSEPKNKQRKDVTASPPTDSKRELTLTTRQRALLSSKDASGASQVEFPNGLPPPPSRKQKEKLTEVEQQLKKAEAAQRRKIQNQKAAKEVEAEAIRKILGQDSSRKKREDKIKKRQEEIAQEKADAAKVLASSTIRLHMGPNGTVVTFSEDMGLPKIFESEIRSYPPPREKCVGPLCTNPYKYRDSKSKLPLCSLQCYKAIQPKLYT